MKLGVVDQIRSKIVRVFAQKLLGNLSGLVKDIMDAAPGSSITLQYRVELDAQTISAFQQALGVTHIQTKE